MLLNNTIFIPFPKRFRSNYG